jgi:heptaprenyl diphosphate synthase
VGSPNVAPVAAPNSVLALPGMPDLRDRVEKRLLATVETTTPALTEMASHLIKAGGKRVRPLFAVAAAATADGAAEGLGFGAGDATGEDAITGGVSVELVHIGSLYHDDVIDEAPTRRTVESVNARWGNLRAILAGDFLLARASELAASLGTDVAELLAATIGRLCEGEVRELQDAYQLHRTEADYLAAIEGKTASLFAAACRIGGIVADLPQGRIDALTDFGLFYGMAFQVVDDVLDVIASEQELGKPAGHDLAEGVYNLPVLRALTGTEGDALSSLLGGPIDPSAQARALELVRGGTGVASAVATAEDYATRAVGALAALPPSPAVDALAGAARGLTADLPARR